MSVARKVGEGLGLSIATLVIVAFIVMITTFPVMLVIGMLHDYHPQVPAIGFWNTWAWLFIVSVVGDRFKTTVNG